MSVSSTSGQSSIASTEYFRLTQQEVESTEQKIQQRADELKKYNKGTKDYDQTIAMLYVEKHKLSKHEKTVLQEENDTLKEQIKKDDIAKEKLTQKAKQCQMEVEAKDKRIGFLNTINDDLSARLVEFREQNTEKESILNRTQRIHDSLNRVIDQKDKIIAQLKNTHNEQEQLYVEQLKKTCKEYQQKLDDIQRIALDKETSQLEEKAAMEASLKDKDLSIETLKLHMHVLKEKEQTSESFVQATSQKASEEKAELETKISKKKVKIKGLKEQCRTLTDNFQYRIERDAKVKQLNDQVLLEQKQFRVQEKEMDTLKTFSKSQTQEINELKKRKGDMDELEKDNDRLAKKVKSAENSLADYYQKQQSKMEELESTIAQLRAKVQKQELKQKEDNAMIVGLTKENNTFKERVEQGRIKAEELARILNGFNS